MDSLQKKRREAEVVHDQDVPDHLHEEGEGLVLVVEGLDQDLEDVLETEDAPDLDQEGHVPGQNVQEPGLENERGDHEVLVAVAGVTHDLDHIAGGDQDQDQEDLIQNLNLSLALNLMINPETRKMIKRRERMKEKIGKMTKKQEIREMIKTNLNRMMEIKVKQMVNQMKLVERMSQWEKMQLTLWKEGKRVNLTKI